MEREAEKKNTFKDVKKQQQQIFFLLKYPKSQQRLQHPKSLHTSDVFEHLNEILWC